MLNNNPSSVFKFNIAEKHYKKHLKCNDATYSKCVVYRLKSPVDNLKPTNYTFNRKYRINPILF